MDERAHELIDDIYRAAVEPDAWQGVVQGVSEGFGGAPCMLGFLVPGLFSLGPRFSVGLREDYLERYLEHLLNDLPWSTKFMQLFADRWGDMGEVIEGVDLQRTELYTEWMKPQGLAPFWPAGHTIADESGETLGGFTVFRTVGQEPVSDREYAWAKQFVPHIRRAVQIHLKLHGAHRVRVALAETIDRLPTGVLLLDAKRRVVIQSRTAERILRADDGLHVDRNGPAAEDARENAALQRLIADAMDVEAGHEVDATGFVAVSRPSGKRAYPVMITPLLAAPGGSVVSDAVVAVFVTDPESTHVAAPEALEDVYQLTHSEAEIVRLLAAGMSLDEAALARGVSMNTARSHLKHVFAKTGTSRQGELVRLVISGVGSMGDE